MAHDSHQVGGHTNGNGRAVEGGVHLEREHVDREASSLIHLCCARVNNCGHRSIREGKISATTAKYLTCDADLLKASGAETAWNKNVQHGVARSVG